MTLRPDTDDYRALFLGDVAMMDMRAPSEFTRGAFPSATSLPLMSDAERAEVGTCYKQRGQHAAIELGHQLVAGDLKAGRLAQWSEFARQHPDGYLYCFRGGLRSQTVQQWLGDLGVDYPLIKGGYKAMRRFLLDELERAVQAQEFLLVSGRTGTGKTRVINRLSRCVDLEGLAGHRGSSFGQLPQGQPSQIDFENALSIGLLKLRQRSNAPVYLEDEGRLIGRLHLPDVLREKMALAPMVIVEESLERRIDVVIEDYIEDLDYRYTAMYGEQGPRVHREKLLDDLSRIRKRLGGVKHQALHLLMEQAFARQHATGDPSGHREWITVLLEQYYDPMYEYQLQQRKGQLLFCGDRDAIVDWAQGRD